MIRLGYACICNGINDHMHTITYTNYLYVQAVSDFIKNVIHERTDVITSGFSGSFTILACHNENELFGKILTFLVQKVKNRVK